MAPRVSDIPRFSVFDWAPVPFLAILWRELLTTLRQQRYGVILLGLAGILLYVDGVNLTGLATWSISPAVLVTNTLSLQCGALLAMVFLVLPALAAVTLASERQQKTEDLLYTALFRPAAVLLGKLLAVLAVFALFHIALLPLSAFIYFFAGIEVESFFQIVFMLYTTALCHTAIGLIASNFVERSNQAVLLAYFFIAALYLLPLAQYAHASNQALGPAGTPLMPPPSPILLMYHLLRNAAGWRECGGLFLFQCAGAAIAGVLCVAARGLGRGFAGMAKSLTGSRATRPRRFRPLPDWGNPIYHKDCRSMPATRPAWALCLFLVAAALAYAFNRWSARELDFSTTALDAGPLVLYVVIPFLVIESCSREMAPNCLSMLRVTRLGSDRVLSGKALAVFRAVAPVVLGLLAGTAVFFVHDGIPLTAAVQRNVYLERFLYQSAMLAPKAMLAVAMCFMVSRFRAPGPADLAATLVLSGVLVAAGETISHGMFESLLGPALDPTRMAIVAAGHLICLGFSIVIVFAIAQMRFEAVFDEGSDIYAISHVDRRNF